MPRLRTLVLFTLLAAIVGCAQEPEPPVFLRGHVVSTDGSPIAGARVTALDINGTPVTGTVTTDASGRYELDVSSVRGQSVTLRAEAMGYAAFPSGIRRSLPINLAEAVQDDDVLVVAGTLTEVALVPLADATGLGSLAGKVEGTGALVVAEGPVTGSTISNRNGDYVIFNLPAGTYTVRAYVFDRNFVPAEGSVIAGSRTDGVDLAFAGTAGGSVNGSVNIVNAPGGSATSVVLVVASTFNEITVRGDVPPGLRAPRTGSPSVTGEFTISGVPDGTYKVLAAFENDILVRDPDPNIAGTQIVEVSVAGAPITLPASFKITEALEVISPGPSTPTEVTGTPTLIWADDSSEDFYTVEVFDSQGNVIWSDPNVPSVSGSPTVSVLYGGPALMAGRTYQFRAVSWRESGGGSGPISTTEDLCGLMFVR